MKKVIIIFGILISIIHAEVDTNNLMFNPRIINGTHVSKNNDMWQFIASLKYNNNHYCGGSLISANWVLTAGHCIVDKLGKPYEADLLDTVGIGSYQLDGMTEYRVKRFILHPEYNNDTFDNDIGLVELDTYVINIASIPYDISHPLSVNTKTKVAGWGTTTAQEEYNLPNDLREALTPILDFKQCNSDTSYRGELTNNMLCAGYFVSTRDSCYGDSGGPLVIDNTLVGIVSGGYGCAKDGYPGIYTKIQNYAKWIKDYIGNIKSTQLAPIIMGDIMTFVPYLK